MDDIPLKVLIIDPADSTADSLARELQQIDVILAVTRRASLEQGAKGLEKTDVNAIYIDPISLDVDEASDFIFRVRRNRPAVAFVLYFEFQKEIADQFYAGERRRFRHYFKLDKATPVPAFAARVKETVIQCQHDLSLNLTREKIAGLQEELADIQEGACEDNVVVPRDILREIQDQLAAWKEETKTQSPQYRPAQFLGPGAQSMKRDQCFIVMPYSESWSGWVETIMKESCEAVGLAFKIARKMEGQFIPQDIWNGITGSAVIIADLTGANASVTYEVGLADAIGCSVVLICQDKKVPFDFSGRRLILYEDTAEGALDLRTALTETLKDIKVDLAGNSQRTD